MPRSFAFSDVESALFGLAEKLHNVESAEHSDQPIGRILAETVLADRDSPAADVSAMDGYAVRLEDLKPDRDIPISGESKAGAAPPSMHPGSVVRIFTGAIVPSGCEAVVKREDTLEKEDSIRFAPAAVDSTVIGSHIRRQGENAPIDSAVIPPGVIVTPAVVAALANFGIISPLVHRPVKVSVFTTGDEVVDPSTKNLEPWQLRNSNRAAVEAMLQRVPFASIERCEHLADDPELLRAQLASSMKSSDVIVMTGGVSKGNYDYVPDTIAEIGGKTVFHGLPIRPGKPILGAATVDGKLFLGLPGNPVSTTINCRRFLIPCLRYIGGQSDWSDKPALVTLSDGPVKPIGLHTMQLVRLTGDGTAELIASRGSGDLVALSKSDGFVCIPPDAVSPGPWPLLRW